jgi:hypothetical protein
MDGVDNRVIRERRDIALYCTPRKLMLTTILRGVADLTQSQLHGEQAGWTEAKGATDAAIFPTALHEQALSRPGYACLIFLDLKKFLPSIPPGRISFDGILHGLPEDMQRLFAHDFAVMVGRYDSQLSVGDPFKIDWGALMGCVLSTHKARMLLDSLLAAIIHHVSGVRPYGGGKGIFVNCRRTTSRVLYMQRPAQ